MRTATARKYARVERERRFLLDRLPAGVDPGRYLRLRDRFLDGTGLRLRRVEQPDGVPILVKLGQKLADPDAPDDPRRRLLTTLYLPERDGRTLGTLPGVVAAKRRYELVEGGLRWTIDVWEEPAGARGLILAEIECDTDSDLDAVVPPAWTTREVTDDPTYSAFAIASRG